MPISGSYSVTRPNAVNDGVDDLEQVIAEFGGMVEGTVKRKSKISPYIDIKPVKGTATLQNYSVGESTLQVLNAGEIPDGVPTEFGNQSVTIDTVVLARSVVPTLATFQTQFDARREIATEHGKRIAKFTDQAFLIQAIKSGLLTASPYGSAGHQGGSKYTLANALDNRDPAKMYSAIAYLFEAMELKDVDPANDDIILAVTPTEFYALMQADQIVSSEYITSTGTKIQAKVFSAFGVPVISTNDLPRSVITGHELSNARNGNAYDGDFSKVVACAFSAKAILAGESIALTSDVFYDKLSKGWFVDAHLSFGATPNRPEYAGVILKP